MKSLEFAEVSGCSVKSALGIHCNAQLAGKNRNSRARKSETNAGARPNLTSEFKPLDN